MKFSHKILAVLALPALTLSALAEQTLGVLNGVIPVDKMMQGRVVRPVLSPDLQPIVAKVQERFNALSEEKKKEIATGMNQDNALDYIDGLWDSKKEYDTYLEAWNKKSVTEREQVAVGFKPGDKENVWNVVSLTIDSAGKTAPLTLSALSYDAVNNTWISNNGTLEYKILNYDDKFVFGAQTGYQWLLEKNDALTSMVERIQITKSKDAKYIFIYYNFLEVSKATGKGIAQGNYVLRFPVQVAGANLTKPGQR